MDSNEEDSLDDSKEQDNIKPGSIAAEKGMCPTILGRMSRLVNLSKRFLESNHCTEDDTSINENNEGV